jgi:hypothetical protein
VRFPTVSGSEVSATRPLAVRFGSARASSPSNSVYRPSRVSGGRSRTTNSPRSPDATGSGYAAALRAGYVERAGGLPEGFAARRPVYEVVRMLGRSGFIDQWTTYLDEPTADLVDRAAAELVARWAAP